MWGTNKVVVVVFDEKSVRLRETWDFSQKMAMYAILTFCMVIRALQSGQGHVTMWKPRHS